MGWGKEHAPKPVEWIPPFVFVCETYDEATSVISVLELASARLMIGDPEMGLQLTVIADRFKAQMVNAQVDREQRA